MTQSQAQSLLHIRVLEGEGAVLAAGVKNSRGIVVQITDETGRPVEGAAVSFRMPEEGPGATFARGMRTDIAITTPDGRAAVYELIAGRLSGPYQVRITAVKGAVRAGTIASQYISDAPASAPPAARRSSGRKWLMFAAVASGGAAAGLAFGLGKGGSIPRATPAPAAATPQIGTPTITIGKP